MWFFFRSKPSCLKPKALSVENVDFWQWSVSMAGTGLLLLHATGSCWRLGIIVLLSESLCFSSVSSNGLTSVPVIANIPPHCLETRHEDDSADGALLYRANSCLAEWYTHIPLMIKWAFSAWSYTAPDLPLVSHQGMQQLLYMWCEY